MEICAVGTVAVLVLISLGYKFRTYLSHLKELAKIRRENENNIAHIATAKSAYGRMSNKASFRSRRRTSL